MNNFMKKLEKFLNKHLMPVADAINSNKVMTAIKDGMMGTLPITLFASIILILTNFPFLDKYAPATDLWLKTKLIPAYPVTMGILAVFIIFAAANSYAKLKKIEPLFGIIVAFASFLIVTPLSTVTDVVVDGQIVKNAVVSGVIPTANLGANGVFTALFVTVISISIYAYLQHKNFVIKMPESVPDNVAKPFLSVIPLVGSLSFFLLVRNLIELTSFGTLQNAVYTILTKPLLGFGNNIWVFLFLLFLAQILWFFGIHGTNVTLSIWQPIATVAMVANLDAFNAGQPLPYLLTAAFTVYTGQAKLSEIVALVALGKSKQAKAIGKVALIPALFNIHEPFVFGLPVMFNTTLFIPWIFVELIQTGVAYGLMLLTGAVPIIQAPWTTPPILQQLIATNFNPWSALIPIATFTVGFVLWAPFIKLLDKQYLEQEKEEIA